MNTLSPPLVGATVLVARHVSLVPSLAVSHVTAPTAGSAAELIVIVIVVLLMMTFRAARGLATLVTQFLHLAATMTSSLLVVIVIVLGTVALLAHG